MFAWGETEVFAKGRRVSRRATTNRRSTDRCTVTNGDRRDARGRAGRRRVRREARAPARVARTGRDATARRGPAARGLRTGSSATTAVGTPARGPTLKTHPRQMTSRTVAGNGPRARGRSGVTRTARGRGRRRPCRRRCGGRRRAVDGGEARRMGSDTFCTRGLDVGRLERDAMFARGPPGNARATLARAVHAESRRTLGAATRAAMEALMTAAILSTVRRATGGGWVLEYRPCRARSPSYRLARRAIRGRRSLIGR